MFSRWSSGGGVAQAVKRAAEYFSQFHENEINIKICMCYVSLMAMVHIYKWVFGNQSLNPYIYGNEITFLIIIHQKTEKGTRPLKLNHANEVVEKIGFSD